MQNAVVLESADLCSKAKNIVKKYDRAKLYADPYELCYADMQKLFGGFGGAVKNRFILEKNFHQKKRSIKSQAEIEKIKISVDNLAKSFDKFAAFLSENGYGKSEKELHFLVKEFLQDRGKFDLSFNPIFAIESNAAKPHALPCDRALTYGDSVLLDAGIKYRDYCSDRTRTAFFGKDNRLSFDIKQSFNDAEKQKIYNTVLSAHNRAIEAIKTGMKAKEIDKIARDHIDNAGYGKYFSHSLGHGVGLEIHEEPYINRKNEMVIENGMVFTIEPGIYIEGFFGVRIENIVEIYDDRARII
ncbi:aminopeptidase [Campylobacterota bacterium]|nr:aminopeptidase [Campylobacterota bacterium]